MIKEVIPKGAGTLWETPKRTIAEREYLLAEKERQGDEESVLKLRSSLLKNYCIHQEVIFFFFLIKFIWRFDNIYTNSGNVLGESRITYKNHCIHQEVKKINFFWINFFFCPISTWSLHKVFVGFPKTISAQKLLHSPGGEESLDLSRVVSYT